jgi:hypothetical protein
MAIKHENEFRMPHIYRHWFLYYISNAEERLNMIYKRPRIDYRVSEYVYEYIQRKILEPRKIKELEYRKYALSINLHFILGGEDARSLNSEQMPSEYSPYNTETTLYSSNFTTNGYELRLGYKAINLSCRSTEIDVNIKPKEYAHIVYNMISTYLETKRYKSITKELMEQYKSEMDYAYIENFSYPAAFVDQRYHDDKRNILDKDLNIRKNYMKFYGEKEEKSYEDEKLGIFGACNIFRVKFATSLFTIFP